MSLTGKTGKYQDEVPGLPGLPVNRYERIFKVYTEKNNGKEFYFYNILNKIEMPSNIDSSLLETYTVKGNEALTTTSYNIYGDIHSWWIIYLLNKETIGNSFFAKGGQELSYILPEMRGVLYQQMTDATVFSNKHF
tara:strand:+ start:333 stop:740 length:408 start_codon:yes stop_codon:yes gene_type:complete